jgi:hypothetical protein
MPLTNILVSEIFYVWGIDFMLHLAIFIFFSLLIMCPNGLRQKPHELTVARPPRGDSAIFRNFCLIGSWESPPSI